MYSHVNFVGLSAVIGLILRRLWYKLNMGKTRLFSPALRLIPSGCFPDFLVWLADLGAFTSIETGPKKSSAFRFFGMNLGVCFPTIVNKGSVRNQ